MVVREHDMRRASSRGIRLYKRFPAMISWSAVTFAGGYSRKMDPFPETIAELLFRMPTPKLRKELEEYRLKLRHRVLRPP
jgi:hypothetical protein